MTSTIASGGVDPDAAFAFSSGSGFEDLVVGNAGDGELALFEGGPDGLSLTSAATEPNLPDPTALAFSALTGGQVQFYAATAGRESAELVALSLGIETGPISPSGAPSAAIAVAQLVPLHESSLPLVATVLTLTITVSGDELNLGLAETEATRWPRSCRGRASRWAKVCRLRDAAARGEMTMRNRTSRGRVSPARSQRSSRRGNGS